MIYELIYNDLKSSKEIIVFGAGDNGRYIAEYLEMLGIPISMFVDSDINKQNVMIGGILCDKLESLNGRKESCLIVTPLKNNKELANAFREKGFKNIYDWDEMRLFIKLDTHKVERYLKKYQDLYKLLKSNEQFRGKYKGHRCFVLGTGPSLKSQDLKYLRNEFVVTVNQFMRSRQFEDVGTNFHVWNDSGYFTESGESEVLQERIGLCKKIGKKAISFLPYNKSVEFVKKNHLDEFLNIYYYQEYGTIPLEKATLNLSSLMPEVGSAVLSAVNIAIYMGFSEIYLLGCDCTDILTVISAKNSVIASAQYAYEDDSFVETQVKYMLGERPLEFIYELQAKKFAAFRKIYEICKEEGVKIFNCTEGGILEGIPRKKYEDVLSVIK